MINVIDYTERHEGFALVNSIDPYENEIIIAEREGFPVGILSYDRRDNGLFISSIGVMDNHRRQGVGSSMVAYLKLKNFDEEITASAHKDSFALISFLQKCDFELTRKQHTCYKFHFCKQDVPVLDLTNRISKHYG